MSNPKLRVTYNSPNLGLDLHKAGKSRARIPGVRIEADKKKRFKAGYLKHKPAKADAICG